MYIMYMVNIYLITCKYSYILHVRTFISSTTIIQNPLNLYLEDFVLYII